MRRNILKKDLLICNEKIEYIADQITEVPEYCEVIDAQENM